MKRGAKREEKRLRLFTERHIDDIPQLRSLPPEQLEAMRAVSAVLPFRVNQYVVEELIDWSRVPDDPIFQLTFPQRGMLSPEHFRTMLNVVRAGGDRRALAAAARPIQWALNPHPAGQMSLNVPHLDGEPLPGMQHKYRETVLFFPQQGQTCHAYCTYCFRWAQFAGLDKMKFQSREPERLRQYVAAHPEVRSVLITGGDPMVMSTRVLRRYIEPLLDLPHLQSIRIGTKAVAYWPHRFVTGEDADALMRLFEEVVARGKTLALMGHYSHPRELSTPVAQAAVKRIRATGAVVRCQAPMIRHVNDDADSWADLWNLQVRLGAIPYYMFIARDTGARGYFEVPLTRALAIFNEAYGRVSGLGRTVRGPSMSAGPGKVLVDGVVEIAGQRAFALKMVQARDPRWVNRVFYAKYDPQATWLDDLQPAFGETEFFFESGQGELRSRKAAEYAKRLRPLRVLPGTGRVVLDASGHGGVAVEPGCDSVRQPEVGF